MNSSIEIGRFKVIKRKAMNRNVFIVSICSKNVSKGRTIETFNSYTEWSEREAVIRYDQLIKYAREKALN
jgi:hypothetical protein